MKGYIKIMSKNESRVPAPRVKKLESKVNKIEIADPGTLNVIHPMTTQIIIDGITEKWANAIRRVILAEIPIRVLKLDSITCGDRYVQAQPQVAQYEISTLKIDQKVPVGLKFEVEVPGTIIPTTSDIVISKGQDIKYDIKKLTNPAVDLIAQVQYTDFPTKITMHVEVYYKYIADQRAASLINQIRYEPLTVAGATSANLGEYRYVIDMHDNITGVELLKLCIEEILRRLTQCADFELKEIGARDSYTQYQIVYENETYTIAGIIYDIVYLINPEIPMFTFEQKMNSLYINIVEESAERVKTIISRAITISIGQWQKLLAQIK